MAKGLDISRERKGKVSSFGKDLTRRSKASCELCGASNEKLEIYEVPPIGEDPVFEHCFFICESCKKVIDNLRKAKENDLRFLNSAVWSEVPIVKAVALHIIREVNGDYHWIEELLDTVYVEEEVDELVKNTSLT